MRRRRFAQLRGHNVGLRPVELQVSLKTLHNPLQRQHLGTKNFSQSDVPIANLRKAFVLVLDGELQHQGNTRRGSTTAFIPYPNCETRRKAFVLVLE